MCDNWAKRITYRVRRFCLSTWQHTSLCFFKHKLYIYERRSTQVLKMFLYYSALWLHISFLIWNFISSGSNPQPCKIISLMLWSRTSGIIMYFFWPSQKLLPVKKIIAHEHLPSETSFWLQNLSCISVPVILVSCIPAPCSSRMFCWGWHNCITIYAHFQCCEKKKSFLTQWQ